MPIIKNIVLHHTGGRENDNYASSSYLTWQDINMAHRVRWPDFPSELNKEYGGYNFYIAKNGDCHQFRYIGEETAAQKGHNQDSVSICLAGNFLVEKPTLEQIARLKTLVRQITGDPAALAVKQGTSIDVYNIIPHRVFQPNTECNCLPDNWGYEIVFPEFQVSLIAKLHKIISALLAKKFAGRRVNCQLLDVRG